MSQWQQYGLIVCCKHLYHVTTLQQLFSVRWVTLYWTGHKDFSWCYHLVSGWDRTTSALTLLSERISFRFSVSFSVSFLASSAPAPSSTHSRLIRPIHSWKRGNICLLSAMEQTHSCNSTWVGGSGLLNMSLGFKAYSHLMKESTHQAVISRVKVSSCAVEARAELKWMQMRTTANISGLINPPLHQAGGHIY